MPVFRARIALVDYGPGGRDSIFGGRPLRWTGRVIVFQASDVRNAAEDALRAGQRLAKGGAFGFDTLGAVYLDALTGARVDGKGKLRGPQSYEVWRWKENDDRGLPLPGLVPGSGAPFAVWTEFAAAGKSAQPRRARLFLIGDDEEDVAASARRLMEDRHRSSPRRFGEPTAVSVARIEPEPITADGTCGLARLPVSLAVRFAEQGAAAARP
jgi:hypothetical protein